MQDRIEIREVPARRLFGLTHRGPYPRIGEAFGRLEGVLRRADMLPRMGTMIAVYHDMPGEAAEADLRSFAAFEVDETTEKPDGVEEMHLPGGAAAVLAHHGSYEALPAAWDDLTGRWLADSGREPDGAPYELYHNTPEEVPPDRLVTDLHLPLKPE